MYIYALLLAIGIFGIVGMALAGFVHIGGGHTGGGHSIGHAQVGHVVHTGQVPHAGAHGHGGHIPKSMHAGAKFDFKSLLPLSPLDFFSYCAGAGLAAFLMRPYMDKALLPFVAVLGAVLFDLLITKTVLRMITRASANPSSGLEGSIATEGVAATNFDENGRGLVKLTLDGQIVQLLATLELPERNAGVRVKKGDSVLVVQVDSAKNCCMVTREFSNEAIQQSVLKVQGKS